MKLDRWLAGWETEYTVSELEELIRKEGYQIITSYGRGFAHLYGGRITINLTKRVITLLSKFWISKQRTSKSLEERLQQNIDPKPLSIQRLENSKLGTYLCDCIGVVAQKTGFDDADVQQVIQELGNKAGINIALDGPLSGLQLLA